MERRLLQKTVLGLLLVIVGIGCLMLAGSLFLPRYLERHVIPRLSAEAGIQAYAVDVRQVGLFSADLEGVRLGTADRPILMMRSIRLEYRPLDLYQGRIRRLKISGVSLRGRFESGRLRINAPWTAGAITAPGTRGPGRGRNEYPAVGEFEVRDAVLICDIAENTLRIPFEIDGRLREDRSGDLGLQMRLYPRDTEVTLHGTFLQRQERGAFEFTAKHVVLERFADLLRLPPELLPKAEGSISGSIDFQLAPFKVASAHVNCFLTRNQIRYKQLQLGQIGGRSAEDASPGLTVSSSDGRHWQVLLRGLSAVSPLPVHLRRLTMEIEATPAGLTGTGGYRLEVPAAGKDSEPRAEGLYFSRPLNLEGRFELAGSGVKKWQLKTVATAEPRGDLCRMSNLRMAAKSTRLGFNLKVDAPAVDVEYDLGLTDARLWSPSFEIEASRLSLRGQTQPRRTHDKGLLLDLDLELQKGRLTNFSTEVQVTRAGFEGQLDPGSNASPRLSGQAGISGAMIAAAGFDLNLVDADLRLPLQWPLESPAFPGSFQAPVVRFRDRNIGALTAELHQIRNGVEFRGRHIGRKIAPFSLSFEGNTDLQTDFTPRVSVRFLFERPAGNRPAHLGFLHPLAEGVFFNGSIRGDGKLGYGPQGFTGELQSELAGGSLQLKNGEAAVEGIHMKLSLPDLPSLRSAEHQKLTFESASLGDLTLTDAVMYFQIESRKSLWLEQGRFRWCGGQVHVQALHLAPEIDEYRVVLFCDRLNLAQVLEQFGAAAVEGEGSLSGRIPLSLRKGQWRFDDGFLFSTPGEGGKLRISDTGILTAGIPEDTPQFAQLELAREALKDYDYEWTQLRLNTEGEELLLRLQMDGKPANLLPFEFNRELGRFVRMQGEGAGARFQGIRLDVNFRLPLNKILRHKGLIRMLQ
jgi:hypothetical protein